VYKYRKTVFCVAAIPALLLMLTGCGSQNKTVLLTGYWPPTNEMLRPFSADPTVNPDGWQGKNWENTGYDVYAYFPEFPGGTRKNPKGDGDFEVDYQDTRADFDRITEQVKPSIIISYGAGGGPWEIEVNALWFDKWYNDFLEPTQPDPWKGEGEPKPLKATLPVEKIREVVQAVAPDLKVWIDYDGDPGNFLCNYMAYLGMQYQAEHDHCKAAGFIHVGTKVDLDTAIKASEATLRAVLQK